jgi:hypothetical protein
MTQVLFSGAWGKTIHKKTLIKKSCDTVSLKGASPDYRTIVFFSFLCKSVFILVAAMEVFSDSFVKF